VILVEMFVQTVIKAVLLISSSKGSLLTAIDCFHNGAADSARCMLLCAHCMLHYITFYNVA